MVIKGQRLPESHRQAIRDGLNRYYSMNDMSQEQKDNISKGQKARLVKRNSSEIEAHKEAISKGTRKFYETHDGPWKGVKRDEQFKNQVSETLKRAYENGHTNGCNGVPLSESTKTKISKGLLEYWKSKKKE